jgi:hypothetical protein
MRYAAAITTTTTWAKDDRQYPGHDSKRIHPIRNTELPAQDVVQLEYSVADITQIWLRRGWETQNLLKPGCQATLTHTHTHYARRVWGRNMQFNSLD